MSDRKMSEAEAEAAMDSETVSMAPEDVLAMDNEKFSATVGAISDTLRPEAAREVAGRMIAEAMKSSDTICEITELMRKCDKEALYPFIVGTLTMMDTNFFTARTRQSLMELIAARTGAPALYASFPHGLIETSEEGQSLNASMIACAVNADKLREDVRLGNIDDKNELRHAELILDALDAATVVARSMAAHLDEDEMSSVVIDD